MPLPAAGLADWVRTTRPRGSLRASDESKPDNKIGSLAKIIGLKNGDVVSEINSQRLGNIDDALAMCQKLRSANYLSVIVERGGALIRKEISIK